jgi:hypothetical protein
MEGNGHGLVYVLSQHLPGGTTENHENFTHNSQSLGQDLNPGPPKHEAVVLTT